MLYPLSYGAVLASRDLDGPTNGATFRRSSQCLPSYMTSPAPANTTFGDGHHCRACPAVAPMP